MAHAEVHRVERSRVMRAKLSPQTSSHCLISHLSRNPSPTYGAEPPTPMCGLKSVATMAQLGSVNGHRDTVNGHVNVTRCSHGSSRGGPTSARAVATDPSERRAKKNNHHIQAASIADHSGKMAIRGSEKGQGTLKNSEQRWAQGSKKGGQS